MNKELKCDRCFNTKDNKILNYSNNNIDNVGHFHIECKVCGRNLNIWDCNDDKIHEMFGNNWRLYL